MKKREITIPTLVGLLIVVGGLVSGIWLVQRQISQSSQAAAESEPKEVVVANVSDSSFVVTWVTDKAVAGHVEYGESATNLDLLVSDDRDQQKGSVDKYFTHFVTIKGLKPDTTYRFKIGSGGRSYDQDGTAYEISTGGVLADTPTADVAYGQVVTANGEPADGALVYLTMSGGNTQAALAKSSGSWVIPLSTIRTSSLNSYVLYDKSATKLDISVNDGPMGEAAVITTTGNDNPVPQIVLGQVRDYSSASGDTTDVEVQDESDSQGSKLGQIPIPELVEKDLKLLTPQSGEAVNSARPEIIGVAPPNSEVTIEIHSEALVSGKVVADSRGNFSFSVPRDLPPGEHTITITTIVDGVIQKVTRSFTVYAQGESFDPAFSATPSATLAPTVRPTATATPTTRPTTAPTPTAGLTATPTVKLTATPTPTVTVTPSTSPAASPTIKPTPTTTPQTSLPSSGQTETTWLLLVLGLGMISAGWWWYRKAV